MRWAQWGGGGVATIKSGERWEGFLAARGPYGLNNVQGVGIGRKEVRGSYVGGGGGVEGGGGCCVGRGCYGGGGWGAVGGGGQPLSTALHTKSIGLQNSFCESHTWRIVSWKALTALNVHWALPVFPVFEEETSNGLGQTKNRSSQKSRKIACVYNSLGSQWIMPMI